MKKIAMILLLSLLLGLFGCAKDANVGVYRGVYVEADGGVYRMEDFYNGENYLELESGGDAVMYINKKEHELEWSLSDGILTFKEAGDAFYGQLSDGIIVLDYMGWGLKLTFALDGAKIPETTVPDPADWAQSVARIQAFWNGDWYGYWCITEASGSYAGQIGKRKDCVAQIALGDDARGTILLYDAEHSRTAPLAECILRVDDTGSAAGIALSGQGSFMGQAVNAGDWLIDPSTAAYDDLIEISGYYADEDGDFFYSVYLHPWGHEWQEDILPDSYAQYQEAIKNGTPPTDILGE